MIMNAVPIPAQSFLMGSDDGRDDERPVHRVWVDAFEIGVTQVTNREYAAFAKATNRPLPQTSFPDPDQPVAVSWFVKVAAGSSRTAIGRRNGQQNIRTTLKG